MIRKIVIPALLSGSVSLTALAKQPNIIFIVTDDQHEDTMGCWGNDDVYTPNIDRLADEGIRFTRAYCSSSISAASRYSVLSGRYSGRCTGEGFMRKFPEGTPSRVDNMVMSLEPDRPNLQNLLRSAGYFTGMVGKWHLGRNLAENRPDRRKKKWEKAGLMYYEQDADPSLPEVREALEHNQKWYAEEVRKTGFDYADNIYWENLKEIYNDSLNHHNIDWTVSGAIDFIRQADNRPFFLYFSTTLHHGPDPLRSVGEQYAKVTGEGISKDRIDVMPSRRSIFRRLKKMGYREDCASALWLDDAVGALLEELEQTGNIDNTVIFYFSDHGIEQKSSLYEGGINTPLIAWGKPLGCSGHVSAQLVHLCDLLPTCLSLAGVTMGSMEYMDGKDMTPLFSAPESKIHESVFSEIGYARSVTTLRYKYIAVRYPDDIQAMVDRGLTEEEKAKIGYIVNQSLCALGKRNPNYFTNDQLYDLEKDPYEQINLADDPEYAAVMSEMRRIMETYLYTFENRPYKGFIDGN